MSKASDIVAIALAEVGYKEKASNAYLDDKTANAGSNNWTKYARDLAKAGYYQSGKNGYAWCDVFVDWCFFKAYGAVEGQKIQCQTGPYGAGCIFSAQYYQQQGRYDKTPRVGDQVFFQSGGQIGHTGIVIAVTDSTITTVEGNSSDQVKKNTQAITNALNREGAATRFGMTKWHIGCVQRILRNYTYTGNLILQKTYRENHLTKKKLINEGQLPQYHVKNAHESIISMETFEAVQDEIQRRAERHRPRQRREKPYPFTGLITCGCCGDRYKRKVTHAGPIWICQTYNTVGKDACPSKAIPEPILEELVSDVALDDLTGLRAENGNRLVFCFKDGSESVKQWKDRSRAESWTPEMKEQASRRQRQRREAMRNGV